MKQHQPWSSAAQLPHSPPPIATHHRHHLPPISATPLPTLTRKLSRRDLALAIATAPLPVLLRLPVARADDYPQKTTPNDCTNTPTTQTAFLDITIDGVPAGRITIALYGGATPLGTARFASLVTGAAGISYRRKEFSKITSNYIQHVGVRSYGVDAELARRTGGELAAEGLAAEWAGERCSVKAGTVGLVVRDPARPPPKLKLVAKKGRLVVDEEEAGPGPNGTEFVIAMRDSAELDDAVLVVGRVVGGMDVVDKIAGVKTVQENSSSPYFRVAKLIGDKRAVVAERGFNRPYSKVVVTNCGLIE